MVFRGVLIDPTKLIVAGLMRSYAAILLVCFAVLCFLFGSQTALAQAYGDTLEPVKVQLKWRHQYQFAGYYAAKELGFYEEAGLDVTLIERTDAIVTPVARLMGGQVDFSVTDTGAMLYRSNGAPLVALATIFQHSPSVLITRAAVTELSSLQGKRVMLSGGYANAELITMLQKSGVDIDRVTVIPTRTSVDVLINGGTDAYNGYTTNEPFHWSGRALMLISSARKILASIFTATFWSPLSLSSLTIRKW